MANSCDGCKYLRYEKDTNAYVCKRHLDCEPDSEDGYSGFDDGECDVYDDYEREMDSRFEWEFERANEQKQEDHGSRIVRGDE